MKRRILKVVKRRLPRSGSAPSQVGRILPTQAPIRRYVLTSLLPAPNLKRVPLGAGLAASLTLTLVTLCLGAAPALATEPCPNEQLREESNANPVTGQPYSTQLPDCRAYELVSPSEAGGWEAPAAHSIAGQPGVNAMIAGEGSSVFYESQAVVPGTGALQNGDYLRVYRSSRSPTGWITRALIPTSTAGNSMLAGVSSNGARALINTTISLVPADVDNPTDNTSETGQDLYLVEESKPPMLVTHGAVANTESPNSGTDFANSELTAVAFNSRTSLEEPVAPGDSTAGCYIWDDAGARLAVLTDPVEASPRPASNCTLLGVTGGGLAVIETNGRLFATDSAGGFPKSSIQLSGETPGAARLVGMSPDGETVYIETSDKLTAEADRDSGADIYAINMRLTEKGSGPPRAPAAVCISCEAAGQPNSGEVTWVGQSGDGSHVFFRLADEAMYEHDAGGVNFVAPAADALEEPVFSHNGQMMVARTTAAISPDDTNGTSDLYLFSEGTSPRLLTSGTSSDVYHANAVSDSGQQVIYEAGDIGERTISEWSEGNISSISPIGATPEYRVLGTAGPELENVFFDAHEALVPADLNAGTTDIYDARVGGGFPAPHEPPDTTETPNPITPAIPAYSGNLTPPTFSVPELPRDTSEPTKAKPLTRAQKLTKALKACKRDKSKTKRATCEKAAHKKYGAKGSSAKKTAKGRKK